VQLLAWLKADSLAWSDGDLGTRSRVSANPRLAGPYVEDAEAAQLDPVPGPQSFFETLKDCVDSRFRFVSRQPGLFDHMMDDVLFDQCLYPERSISDCICRSYPLILGRTRKIVNGADLPQSLLCTFGKAALLARIRSGEAEAEGHCGPHVQGRQHGLSEFWPATRRDEAELSNRRVARLSDRFVARGRPVHIASRFARSRKSAPVAAFPKVRNKL
jgi:hypothetical protein